MSKIAQIYYYYPQFAGINVQSPQSESTPRRLNFNRNSSCLLNKLIPLCMLLFCRSSVAKLHSTSSYFTLERIEDL